MAIACKLVQASFVLLWPLAVTEPWTEENAAWNANWEARHEPLRYWGHWQNHKYFPSPSDWRSLVIYQLMTDRFADGDPRNNELFAGEFDVREMTLRHGGDFAGLTQKLHYIKGLGCNAVWISPVFQNGVNSYHQYSQMDFTVLDRRLGTLEELRNLVLEAHALDMYVIVDIVMNHMANEYYFEGHPQGSAPWRFHEKNGQREYRLKSRATQATYLFGSVWCGQALWQSWGNESAGILTNWDACQGRCDADPDCFYFLYKNDTGASSTYHCAGFTSCSAPVPYEDGKAHVYKKWVWPVKAVQEANGVWCGGSVLWQEFGDNASGILENQDACEAACASESSCQFYLWKDDPGAWTRFHCAGFATCAEADKTPYTDGTAKIFRKRTKAERDEDGLRHTPAGRQPYSDFWYSNSWAADAQYNGTVYGATGEPASDSGFGTYIDSDFHHNGDLSIYVDPWEICLGKLYGAMDDLRLENERVQQKYLAMTKALLDSTDVDGFRIDTPMQVPLSFFKAWAPAVRAHAASLGKHRFGMFGEFYVSSPRYATMTGRGRDRTMYNQDRFIDEVATMKGGIVYPYYAYMYNALWYQRPQYADGFHFMYAEERKMIDTYDPTTNRHEYAMWTFCNNHDNWRLQSLTWEGKAYFVMCLAVITFWPGIPLHYAGDEQEFDTPGTALDGWAREELSTSMAWRAIRTRSDGNPADADSFDMTAWTYRYIARLNALRRAYFGQFGSEECDRVQAPSFATPDVLVFLRGCTSKVLVFANFHSTQNRSASMDALPWIRGTQLVDCLASQNPTRAIVSDGVSVSLGPMQTLVFVEDVVAIPPSIVEVFPRHGSTISVDSDNNQSIRIRVRFDRPVGSLMASSVLFDHLGGFVCAKDTCVLDADALNGNHTVEVSAGATAADGTQVYATFKSFFWIDRAQDGAHGVLAHRLHEQPGLICSFRRLCHNAVGATSFRARNVEGTWSEWRPYASATDWEVQLDVPVLVQYHAQFSSSFIVGDCLSHNGRRCPVHWHAQMFLKGAMNGWGIWDEGRMTSIDAYTWASNITLSQFVPARFVPTHDWSVSYGMQPTRRYNVGLDHLDDRYEQVTMATSPKAGSEASRRWMVDRGLWSAHEAIASFAEFATHLWLGPSCTAAAPDCDGEEHITQWECSTCMPPEKEDCYEHKRNDQSEEMRSCGSCTCCRKSLQKPFSENAPEVTCCVKFNDLFLNYTVTPDLSQCAPSGHSPDDFVSSCVGCGQNLIFLTLLISQVLQHEKLGL